MRSGECRGRRTRCLAQRTACSERMPGRPVIVLPGRHGRQVAGAMPGQWPNPRTGHSRYLSRGRHVVPHAVSPRAPADARLAQRSSLLVVSVIACIERCASITAGLLNFDDSQQQRRRRHSPPSSPTDLRSRSVARPPPAPSSLPLPPSQSQLFRALSSCPGPTTAVSRHAYS